MNTTQEIEEAFAALDDDRQRQLADDATALLEDQREAQA